MQTRRAHLASLVGAGVSAALPRSSRAAVGDDIPPEGIGRGIRHLSYSDQGGRPDGVQVMLHRGHLYVGHMFNDGVTVLDARDPRALKPLNFFTTAPNTRTHHLQVAEGLMLLANGANIVRMQAYDSTRDYFENTLADSLTNRQPFRAGLSIFDIDTNPGRAARDRVPARCPVSASIACGGPAGVTRTCRRTSTVSRITFSCIVDLANVTQPEIVSRWWLPGMHRAGGETPTAPQGKRYALHHMLVAGDRGYAAWRDGGLTIHDVSDAANPKLLSHVNWSPPYPGGTHTALPLPQRQLVVVADESNADFCAKGLFYTWIVDARAETNPVPIATLPTPTGLDFCAMGNFGPHNLHENRPGTFVSEETIFATYHNAGVRVFDIRDQYQPKEIASWLPPMPERMLDPRPRVARNALTCDCYVTTDGIIYATDWNAGLHVLQYEG